MLITPYLGRIGNDVCHWPLCHKGQRTKFEECNRR